MTITGKSEFLPNRTFGRPRKNEYYFINPSDWLFSAAAKLLRQRKEGSLWSLARSWRWKDHKTSGIVLRSISFHSSVIRLFSLSEFYLSFVLSLDRFGLWARLLLNSTLVEQFTKSPSLYWSSIRIQCWPEWHPRLGIREIKMDQLSNPSHCSLNAMENASSLYSITCAMEKWAFQFIKKWRKSPCCKSWNTMAL